MNRTARPHWEQAVRTLTDGGVDHVVETGTLETLPRSIASCAPDGQVALAAVLGAGSLKAPVLGGPVTLRRYYVGSRAAFQAMIAAISAAKLRPVIDTTYALSEAREAYRRLASGRHVGKVVIGG